MNFYEEAIENVESLLVSGKVDEAQKLARTLPSFERETLVELFGRFRPEDPGARTAAGLRENCFWTGEPLGERDVPPLDGFTRGDEVVAVNLAEWREHPGFRACSLTTRGIWLEMLCVMHYCQPRGFFAVNGIAPSDDEAARIIGCTVGEYRAAIDELEKYGVLSRNEDGLISSGSFCQPTVNRLSAEFSPEKTTGKTRG